MHYINFLSLVLAFSLPLTAMDSSILGKRMAEENLEQSAKKPRVEAPVLPRLPYEIVREIGFLTQDFNNVLFQHILYRTELTNSEAHRVIGALEKHVQDFAHKTQQSAFADDEMPLVVKVSEKHVQQQKIANKLSQLRCFYHSGLVENKKLIEQALDLQAKKYYTLREDGTYFFLPENKFHTHHPLILGQMTFGQKVILYAAVKIDFTSAHQLGKMQIPIQPARVRLTF